MRVVVLAGLMTVTACAGPHAPFDVGTQNAPINLVLGARQAVVSAPVGPVVGPLPPSLAPFVPQAPGPGSSAVPSLPPVVQPPALPCPPFDPLAPVVATNIVLPGKPQPATYVYRAKIVDTMGTKKATYQGNSSWKVTTGAVDPSNGSYQTTIDVTVGKVTTRRVLLMLPQAITSNAPKAPVPGANTDPDSPDATDPNAIVGAQVNGTLATLGLPPFPRVLPNPGRYGPAGIYLVSQSNGTSTFTPTVPIPLVQTPIGSNSFTGMGTDGSTVMSFTSTVKKRTNVNACGTKVEGIEVSLTDGRIAGPGADGTTQQVSFTEDLVFGLQFGGIPVQDNGKIATTTVPGVTPDAASREFTFTVNTVPKPARS
jgi:hypothetical protein